MLWDIYAFRLDYLAGLFTGHFSLVINSMHDGHKIFFFEHLGLSCRDVTQSNQAHLFLRAMTELSTHLYVLYMSLALFFSPSLSPFCTAPSVWVYIYHPCVRPGEWARGMERKTIMPSLLALRSRPPINNYGWRASPTAHGMGICSPSAQPWAARSPWEPFSQGHWGRTAGQSKVEANSRGGELFLLDFLPVFLWDCNCLSLCCVSEESCWLFHPSIPQLLRCILFFQSSFTLHLVCFCLIKIVWICAFRSVRNPVCGTQMKHLFYPTENWFWLSKACSSQRCLLCQRETGLAHIFGIWGNSFKLTD